MPQTRFCLLFRCPSWLDDLKPKERQLFPEAIGKRRCFCGAGLQRGLGPTAEAYLQAPPSTVRTVIGTFLAGYMTQLPSGTLDRGTSISLSRFCLKHIRPKRPFLPHAQEGRRLINLQRGFGAGTWLQAVPGCCEKRQAAGPGGRLQGLGAAFSRFAAATGRSGMLFRPVTMGRIPWPGRRRRPRGQATALWAPQAGIFSGRRGSTSCRWGRRCAE